MKESLFVVDGYNVIRNQSPYHNLGLKDLETARARLTEDLVDFAALAGAQIVLVFDGSKGRGKVSQRKKFPGVEVWFTSRGETADQAIEKLVFQVKNKAEKRKIIVVTSDYGLQKIVFGKGALRWSPREMVSEIVHLKEEALSQTKEKREFKRNPKKFI